MTDFEQQAFDQNLREFAVRVGHVCSLEAGGKLPPAQAYEQVKALWKELKRSYKGLNISSTGAESGDAPSGSAAD